MTRRLRSGLLRSEPSSNQEKKRDTQAGLRLWDLLLLRRGAWGIAFILGWVTWLGVIALLAISGWFITAAAAAGMTLAAKAYTFDYFRPAALIRLAAIVRTAGRYGERLCSHYAVLGLLADLRRYFFKQLLRHKNWLARESAERQHRLLADIDLLDAFPLKVVLPWAWAGVMALMLSGYAWWLSPTLMGVVLPTFLLIFLWLPLWGRPVIREAQKDALENEVRHIKVIEIMQLRLPLIIWQQFIPNIRFLLRGEKKAATRQKKQEEWRICLALGQELILACGLIGVLGVGISLIANGLLAPAWLLSLILAYLGFGEIILPLAASLSALGQTYAARDRLNDLIDEGSAPLSSSPQPFSPLLSPLQPASSIGPLLGLGTLCWQWKDLQVQHALYAPLNVIWKTGDVVLLRGLSGIGKTQLLDTISGLLSPESGELRLNGASYNIEEIAPFLHYLPQSYDLFDLSLGANLRLGNNFELVVRQQNSSNQDIENEMLNSIEREDQKERNGEVRGEVKAKFQSISDKKLWQVLEKVNLRSWAEALPQGLKTPLGEYGTEVSGGQGRRLALARLLLKNKPLFIADEPFAGLDSKTAEKVLDTLVETQQDGILILVSHEMPPLPEGTELTIYHLEPVTSELDFRQ